MLSQFMKERNITYDLQNNIQKNLKYIWKNEESLMYTRDFFISLLSQNLKEKFLDQAYSKILTKLSFFNQIYNYSYLRKLIFFIQSSIYSPEEIIYEVFIIIKKLIIV